MSFMPSRSRPVARPRSRSAPVMAVGRRVFVNSAGGRTGSVGHAGGCGGIPTAGQLGDGIEVEVVAWQPRGASDTRYRVRASNGADGWLPAANLRTVLVPPPPPEPPTPAQATTVADASRRRFGQHF